MGLFGFGKKKRQSEEAAEAAAEENDKADEAISETAEAPAGGIQETILPEPSDEYDGRGDEHGPWDVDDENVPDYDEYLDMGAYYLPFLQGIELRVKANRATQQVLGTTITYGSSSVEIEAFAAPKTMGLWDDVRADLVEANKDAKETDGVFGTELTLPVVVKGGRKVVTRIVGVDGPRWMLRGIFSGKAATDPDHAETKALNQLFSNIVVERGEDPLAPRDLIRCIRRSPRPNARPPRKPPKPNRQAGRWTFQASRRDRLTRPAGRGQDHVVAWTDVLRSALSERRPRNTTHG